MNNSVLSNEKNTMIKLPVFFKNNAYYQIKLLINTPKTPNQRIKTADFFLKNEVFNIKNWCVSNVLFLSISSKTKA